MLKILPIILSRISQKNSPIVSFILVSNLLFRNNTHLLSVASLVFKMLIEVVLPELMKHSITYHFLAVSNYLE